MSPDGRDQRARPRRCRDQHRRQHDALATPTAGGAAPQVVDRLAIAQRSGAQLAQGSEDVRHAPPPWCVSASARSRCFRAWPNVADTVAGRMPSSAGGVVLGEVEHDPQPEDGPLSGRQREDRGPQRPDPAPAMGRPRCGEAGVGAAAARGRPGGSGGAGGSPPPGGPTPSATPSGRLGPSARAHGRRLPRRRLGRRRRCRSTRSWPRRAARARRGTSARSHRRCPGRPSSLQVTRHG